MFKTNLFYLPPHILHERWSTLTINFDVYFVSTFGSSTEKDESFVYVTVIYLSPYTDTFYPISPRERS